MEVVAVSILLAQVSLHNMVVRDKKIALTPRCLFACSRGPTLTPNSTCIIELEDPVQNALLTVELASCISRSERSPKLTHRKKRQLLRILACPTRLGSLIFTVPLWEMTSCNGVGGCAYLCSGNRSATRLLPLLPCARLQSAMLVSVLGHPFPGFAGATGTWRTSTKAWNGCAKSAFVWTV